MATISVAQSGLWPNPATWSGGVVPGNGDRVLNSGGYTVTIPAGTTVVIGDSPPAGNSVWVVDFRSGSTLINNGTLVVRGNVLGGYGSNTLICGPGSTFRFDGSQAAANYRMAWVGPIQLNGTVSQHCTFTSDPAGANGFVQWEPYDGPHTIAASYTDFSRLGSPSISAFYSPQGSASGNALVYQNCTFDNCGLFYINPVSDSATIWRFEDCRWTNSVYAYPFQGGYGAPITGVGVRRFLRCSFDKPPYFTALQDLTIDTCVFGQSLSVLTNAGRTALVARSLFYNPTRNEHPWAGDMLDVLVHEGYTDGTNPHPLTPRGDWDTTYDGVIFGYDGTAGDGDCVQVQLGTGNAGDPVRTMTMRRCLVLRNPAGEHTGTVATMGGSVTSAVDIDHCTGVAGFEQLLSLGENYTGRAGMARMRSTLGHRTPSVVGTNNYLVNSYSSTNQVDIAYFADLNHNATWGLKPGSAGKGYNLPLSGTPGAGDLTEVDPQFVDPTRTLATWDASLGGPGTSASARDRCLADPTLVPVAIQWIRAGYAPQNPAYATAAHDGTTIGAVPYQAPAPTPIAPAGIASAEAVGSPAVAPGPVTLLVAGIPSAEGIGSAALGRGPVTLGAVGIASAEWVGVPAVLVGSILVPISPAGIASAELFGVPTVQLGSILVPIGPIAIPSAELFGRPTVGGPILIDREFPLWLKTQLGQPVWRDRLNQKASRPALVFQFTGGETAQLLSGIGSDVTVFVQLDSYGDTPEAAAILMARVHDLLAGYRGLMGRAFCQTANPHGPSTGVDLFGSGSDDGLYRRSLDFSLVFDIPPPIR